MLSNAAPAQLKPKKPKMPSIMVKKRNSKQILPSSNSLAINSLVVASKKPLQISKKPLNSTLNSFNDPAYLARLLAYQEENFNKINTTKTRFFPLGTNSSIKTQDIIVFIGMKGGKTQFCKLSDFGVIQFPQIKFPDDLQKLVTGNLIEDFKKVGWIILQGGQLGFLLDLESLEESRKGNFPSHWKNLVGTEFFFHKLKEEKFTAVFRNQYIPPISSCPKITSDMLVLHQKEDVRWMYNLEQNHKFELRETNSPQALFFFDTGYCLTNVQTKLTTAFHSLSFLEIPGGIFNSQTGNGKAASVVELISSETCMKTPRQNSENQSLIVTSEETLFQWKQEFEKFAPAVRVLVIAELSDWEKLGFEASMNGENTLIKDYQVILAHRKVFELKEKIAPKIFTVNFKRIVLDDIHEVLARYNKRQELFEEMRFAQIQYLNKQENDLSASNGKNNSQFLQVIKDLQKKFLWGVSSACIPAKIAQAFQNLFPINLLNYPPQKTQEINKRFLELHFRTNTVSKEEITTDIEKSVIKVQPYSIHNFYLNPASARDLPDQDMINKIAKTQLAEFRVPDEENNCVSEALEIINYKQQSDIRRIEAETKAENDDRSALFERIEALKGPSSFYAEATQLLRSSEFDCPVCLEDHPTEKITMLSCLHYFCEDCYKQFSETEISKCPVCTKFINAQDLIMHPLYRVSAENKFTFLLKEITGPSSEGKIIIFAHYQSVLETISQSLHQFGVPSYVLKGDRKEMSKTLEDFKKSSDVKILLLTVKQGKTGINIPEANNVFFLQPLFEADGKKAALVYNQCVGRVMRMGQNKKVNVKLFVTDAFEDHVEDIFMNPWN